MDYSKVLDELNNASLFDLYRLNTAIWQQIEDPKKVRLIKDRLKVGQSIMYFEESENRLIAAEVMELKRTRALVRNAHDQRLWNIHYHLINIDNVETDITAKSRQKLSKSNLKVGDKVCFKDRKGNELFGEVVKLNPKTAGVLVGDARWKVSYGLLMPIINGELGSQLNLLEGEVLGRK